MRGGYENLIWVNDKNGKEYVCFADDNNSSKVYEDLSEDQQKGCDDVNQLVGTERW